MGHRKVICVAIWISVCGCGRRDLQLQQKAWREARDQREAEAAQYESNVSATRATLAKQYDRDKDGRLSGAEQSQFDAYIETIRAGQSPNPFKSNLGN